MRRYFDTRDTECITLETTTLPCFHQTIRRAYLMILRRSTARSKRLMWPAIFLVLLVVGTTAQKTHAYGTVSRAGCGQLGVLESITYTVFPSESNDYLYVISRQWTRYNGQPWTFRGEFHDGWDTVHTRAGQFYVLSNVFSQAGYVFGYHYVYKNGVTTRVARTQAGDCNLYNWY